MVAARAGASPAVPGLISPAAADWAEEHALAGRVRAAAQAERAPRSPPVDSAVLYKLSCGPSCLRGSAGRQRRPMSLCPPLGRPPALKGTHVIGETTVYASHRLEAPHADPQQEVEDESDDAQP